MRLIPNFKVDTLVKLVETFGAPTAVKISVIGDVIEKQLATIDKMLTNVGWIKSTYHNPDAQWVIDTLHNSLDFRTHDAGEGMEDWYNEWMKRRKEAYDTRIDELNWFHATTRQKASDGLTIDADKYKVQIHVSKRADVNARNKVVAFMKYLNAGTYDTLILNHAHGFTLVITSEGQVTFSSTTSHDRYGDD